MTEDKRRLKRLRLIERVRSVEQRQAVQAANQAETTRQRLEQLSDRTRSLAQTYAARDPAGDGADLYRSSMMAAQLRHLGRTADAQASHARQDADARMVDLATAERRRQRAEDQRRDAHQALMERLSRPENTPVRKVGTVVE